MVTEDNLNNEDNLDNLENQAVQENNTEPENNTGPETPEEEEIPLKKIIYLDDVNYALISLKENLKKDYEVYPAQSLEKMFELMERIKFDLILLDVNMPDINGFEALEKIKADRRYADIPIMFFTSRKDKDSIIKGMRLGAVDFINKPVTSTEFLIESIEMCLDPKKRASIKPVILAVDDTPSILQAINSLLSDIYTVYTLPQASNDQVIKELLRKTTPDLFLLDCNMPGLSGFDLVPIIRAFPGHEETPIVFLTSEKSMDHISVALGLGAVDYIVKPIDENILRQKLAKHLKDFMILRRIRSFDDSKK